MNTEIATLATDLLAQTGKTATEIHALIPQTENDKHSLWDRDGINEQEAQINACIHAHAHVENVAYWPEYTEYQRVNALAINATADKMIEGMAWLQHGNLKVLYTVFVSCPSEGFFFNSLFGRSALRHVRMNGVESAFNTWHASIDLQQLAEYYQSLKKEKGFSVFRFEPTWLPGSVVPTCKSAADKAVHLRKIAETAGNARTLAEAEKLHKEAEAKKANEAKNEALRKAKEQAEARIEAETYARKELEKAQQAEAAAALMSKKAKNDKERLEAERVKAEAEATAKKAEATAEVERQVYEAKAAEAIKAEDEAERTEAEAKTKAEAEAEAKAKAAEAEAKAAEAEAKAAEIAERQKAEAAAAAEKAAAAAAAAKTEAEKRIKAEAEKAGKDIDAETRQYFAACDFLLRNHAQMTAAHGTLDLFVQATAPMTTKELENLNKYFQKLMRK